MRRGILAIGLLALAAGCYTPQTLEFKEDSAILAGFRVEGDLRYHKVTGWDFPAPPGTREAEDRENWAHQVGGGILFRFHGNLSSRNIQEDDEVRSGEIAIVDDTSFTGPVTVSADIDVLRQDFGCKFGFFTDRHLFGGGLGMFLTSFQIAGSVSSATKGAAFSNRNLGLGWVLYLEGSPGYPPVRFYAEWTRWASYEGPGYFQGSDSEYGVRAQFRGFTLFAGYRLENFLGRLEHNVYTQSRLDFEVRGPIFGLGITF